MSRGVAASVALLAIVACDARPLGPVPTPCTTVEYYPRMTLEGHPDSVVVLVVLDDSPELEAERARFNREVLWLVEQLARREVDDVPGTDFRLRALRVAVITSDLGAGASAGLFETVPGCEVGTGDDGLFVRASGIDDPACPVEPGAPVVTFMPGEDPSAGLAELACRLAIAPGSCSPEQPLGAIGGALTPREPGPDPIVSWGHAEGRYLEIKKRRVRTGTRDPHRIEEARGADGARRSGSEPLPRECRLPPA